MVHDVLVVDVGLVGDQVVLPVVRQLEVEADVGGLLGRHLRAGKADRDVAYICCT